MNATPSTPDGRRPRRTAILVALLVALLGLTIAPGFKCIHDVHADGSTHSEVEAE